MNLRVMACLFCLLTVAFIADTEACTCPLSGSLQRTGVETQDGCSCSCKRFVEEPFCDRCKEGYFDLSADDADGCRPCYCSGVSTSCNFSALFRYDKVAKPGDAAACVTLDAQPTPIQMRVVAGMYVVSDFLGWTQPLFWRLPAAFGGYQGDAYGGWLRYTVNFISDGTSVSDVDVAILSSSLRLNHWLPRRPVSGDRMDIAVRMVEGLWLSETNRTPTRQEFMRVLSDVTSILIRSSYSTGTRQSALANVRLSGINTTNRGFENVSAVERCDCPIEYSGLSCEECAPGFERSASGVCLSGGPSESSAPSAMSGTKLCSNESASSCAVNERCIQGVCFCYGVLAIKSACFPKYLSSNLRRCASSQDCSVESAANHTGRPAAAVCGSSGYCYTACAADTPCSSGAICSSGMCICAATKTIQVGNCPESTFEFWTFFIVASSVSLAVTLAVTIYCCVYRRTEDGLRLCPIRHSLTKAWAAVAESRRSPMKRARDTAAA